MDGSKKIKKSIRTRIKISQTDREIHDKVP